MNFVKLLRRIFWKEKLTKLRLSCRKSAEIAGALPRQREPRVDLEGMGAINNPLLENIPDLTPITVEFNPS